MKKLKTLKVVRESDDPLALRASIGGEKVAGEGNFYLVYRGDPRAVLRMLQAVTAEAERHLAQEPRRPQG